jgi:hypothetical protein
MTEMSAADRLKKLKYHGQYGEMIRIADEQIARLRALWCEEKSKAMTFHAEVERLRAELAQRTAERDALKERLAVVGEIARLAPELNPNNYDHDEVCQLNDAMIALAKEVKP